MWNARILSQENGVFTLGCESWNRDLAPGQSVQIGFDAAPGRVTQVPRTVQVRSGKPPVLTPAPWAPSTFQGPGQEVTFEGAVWICGWEHTSMDGAQPGLQTFVWQKH